MFVAWTTVPTKVIADTLAASAVHARLAVCVQVDGPITSHYVWEGMQAKIEEYRLTFKVLPEQVKPLETWLQSRHPYQIHEWFVVKVSHVAEKYLSWAQASPNS
jgi:periplasmic divalent cation tolerance protein